MNLLMKLPLFPGSSDLIDVPLSHDPGPDSSLEAMQPVEQGPRRGAGAVERGGLENR
jgi:hypothetical protein